MKRVLPDQALTVPAEPQAGLIPPGFDHSRIGFTGTQWGWTSAQACTTIMRLSILRLRGAVWMHNGDCVGSDQKAAARWISLGGRLHLHPPSRDDKRAFLDADASEEPKPYLDRNTDIAERGSALVATPVEMFEQLRSGTWSTIRRARKLGKPVYIIWPNGAETIERDSDRSPTGGDRGTLSSVHEGAGPQDIAR